jgi:hypothetical protein
MPAIPVVDVREGGFLHHAAQSRARARFAQCVPRALPTRSNPICARVGSSGAPLAHPLQLALCGGNCPSRGTAWLSRRLAPQLLVSMELHLDGARREGRPLDGAHARLAISRSWAARGCCPRSGACRGLLQRHLAWLRWRAHSDGAVPVRRLHQPGANVAPYAPSLAASLRHCGERSALGRMSATFRRISCCARRSRAAGHMAPRRTCWR